MRWDRLFADLEAQFDEISDAEAAAELADRQRVAIGAVRATQRWRVRPDQPSGCDWRGRLDRRGVAVRRSGLAAARRGAGAGVPRCPECGHRGRGIDRSDRARADRAGVADGFAAGLTRPRPGPFPGRRRADGLAGWSGRDGARERLPVGSDRDRLGRGHRHHRPGRRGLHRNSGPRRLGTAPRGHRPIGARSSRSMQSCWSGRCRWAEVSQLGGGTARRSFCGAAP